MGIDTALIAVARELGKQIARIWVTPRTARSDREASLVDLLAIGVPDQIRRRKLARQIEEIADHVSERLMPFCEHEFRDLSVQEKEVVVSASAEIIAASTLTDRDLAEQDYNAVPLGDEVLRQAAQEIQQRCFSRSEQALCELVIREAVTVLCKAVQQLPQFGPRVLAELLQRSSRMADDVAEVLDRVPRASLMSQRGTAFDGDFQTRYKSHISATQDRLELFGLDTRTYRLQTSVSAAFLSLNVVIDGANNFVQEHDSEGRIPVARHGSKIESALRRSNKLLVRGDAGCGKTTLLQWLAISASRGTFGAELSHWNGITPFLIRLRSYFGRALPRPEEFLDLTAGAISGLMPDGWVHRQLEAGDAILLVDGVDEVPLGDRARVKRWLHDLLASYPDLNVVVTTRPAAAAETWLANEKFRSASVEPMRDRDVESFCLKWHDAVREAAVREHASLPCTVDELPAYRRSVLRHLDSRKHLKRLATNPLMCAMLCALNLDRRRQLPPDRMRIYADAIQLLLDRRDAEREIPSALTLSLSATQKLSILQYLAWRVSEIGRAELPKAEAIEHVRVALDRIPGSALDASDVMTYLLDRSGMIREPVPGRIDFVHRTFQEYLAAKECSDCHAVSALLAKAHLDQWRETVIMAAGHFTGPNRIMLLQGIIDRAEVEPTNARRLRLLAAACVETATVLPSEMTARIDDALSAVLPPRARREARSIALAGERALSQFPASLEGLTDAVAEGCIYAAGYIGGSVAVSLLANYATDRRWKVQNALQSVWDYFDPDEFAREVLARSRLSAWRGGDDGCLTVSRPEALGCLSEIPGLKAVRYNPRHTVSVDFDSILEIENLHSLSLSPSRPISVDALRGHPTLEMLGVYSAGVASGFEVLPEIPNARSLHVSLRNAPEGALDHISEMKILSDLDLFQGNFEGGLERISNIIGRLTQLTLSGCKSVRSLDLLRGSSLDWLRLSDCPIVDLDPLNDVLDLQALWISGTLSPLIGQIAEHPSLAVLMIYDEDIAIDLRGLSGRKSDRPLTVRVWRRSRGSIIGMESLPSSIRFKYI